MEKIFSTELKAHAKTSYHFLTLGLSPEVVHRIDDLLGCATVTSRALDMDTLDEPIEPVPQVILVGLQKGMSVAHVGQVLRMIYMTQIIFLVCTEREGYDRANFIKNGFTDSYLLPLDWVALRNGLTDALTQITQGSVRTYRSVKLIDIQAGSRLEFDTAIYLPLNDRYIKYSAAGDILDQERLNQLKKHKMKTIFVPNDQISKFYQYTASTLSDICHSTKISETERSEKLKTAVRELMGGIFKDNVETATFEQGRELAADCQEVVRAYITTAPQNDWCERIITAMADVREVYSHGGNVSTYAALFSMGLGIGKPEELAIAGMLHDIGLVDVPTEIQEKPETDWSHDERSIYQKHPANGVDILKKRRIILPENVIKMIGQHHEAYDGSGYPDGLKGSRILPEAQILAFADYFDYLTSINRGKALMSPREVLDFMVVQLSSGGGERRFDPSLVEKIIDLFSEMSQKAA